MRQCFLTFGFMDICYQGEAGAYGHIAANIVAERLGREKSAVRALPAFADVWKSIESGSIGVLPVENSYAGSIYENLFSFLRYDAVIQGEIGTPINHCLWSHEKNLADVRQAYSHEQALRQCHDYLSEHDIEAVKWYDTAGAAKTISEERIPGTAAVASALAGELYGLRCLAEGIQDQEGNTTRFLIVTKTGANLNYPDRKNKTSVLFQTADVPAVLYKCLGAFATNHINLSKIESLPSQKEPFTYMFWVDFEWSIEDDNIQSALQELAHFTKSVKILGTY